MPITFNDGSLAAGSVGRHALNTTAPGQAVVTKIVAGAGISIGYTGTDPGTGDVTIHVDIGATSGGTTGGGTSSGGGGASNVGTVTSINMVVPTGLEVYGVPLTSAGTINLALSSGYTIPLIADIAKGETGYLRSIIAATVTGTNTKTLTLFQQNGNTVSTTFTDINLYNSNGTLTADRTVTMSGNSLSFNGGAVIFGSTSSAFYWSHATQRLGVGTSSPAFVLDVNGTFRVTSEAWFGGTQNFFYNVNPYIFYNRASSVGGIIFAPANVIDTASSNAVVIFDTTYGNITYTAGTHTFNALSILAGINVAAGYTGTIRGYYYNPTITSIGGATHYAFESTSGSIKISDLSGSGTRMVVANSSGVLSTQTISSLAIGSTITSATAGSVLFAGTSGVLAQNNTNFFWDNATQRLGLGTTAPAYLLDVNGSVRAGANGFYGNNGTVTGGLIKFNSSNLVNIDPQGFGATTNYNLTINGVGYVTGRISTDTYVMVKGGTSTPGTTFVSYGIGRPDTLNQVTALAGFGGVYEGANWYNGLALSFFVSSGSDISGGGSRVEKMRLKSAGDLLISNLAGTGTRMVVADSTGTLSTQSISSGTMAIGGGITSASQGSILFAGASGVLSQNNASLYWNDSTGRFGVGTNAPVTLMHVESASTNQIAIFKGVEPYIEIAATGGTNSASLFFSPAANVNATIQNRTGGGLQFYVNSGATLAMTIKSTGRINFSALPTSSTGLSTGDLWNDAGVVKIA